MDSYFSYCTNVVIRDSTVWVSQLMIRKFCGISEKCLTNARSKYKQCISRSWRWRIINGTYYYDVDSIPDKSPSCFRSHLPLKRELIAELEVCEHGRCKSYEKRVGTIRKRVLSMVDANDVSYFEKQGFKNIQLRHITKYIAWHKFIKWVIKYDLYSGYGFNNKTDFLVCCSRLLKKQELKGFQFSSLSEFYDKICLAPDDPVELRRYAIDCSST